MEAMGKVSAAHGMDIWGHLEDNKTPNFSFPDFDFLRNFRLFYPWLNPHLWRIWWLNPVSSIQVFFFRFLDPGNSHRASSSSKCNFWPWKKKPLWFSFNQKTIQKHWILKATHCCYSETWCRRGDHRELVDVAGASGKLSSSSVLRVEGSPRGEFQQRKAGTTYKVVPHS